MRRDLLAAVAVASVISTSVGFGLATLTNPPEATAGATARAAADVNTRYLKTISTDTKDTVCALNFGLFSGSRGGVGGACERYEGLWKIAGQYHSLPSHMTDLEDKLKNIEGVLRDIDRNTTPR